MNQQYQGAYERGTMQMVDGIHWHSLGEEDALKRLESSREGLTQREAARRLAEYGPNQLPVKKPPTLLVIFIHQFLSPLIYVLLAAGVIAIFMGDATDAAFIFGVVLINAALGTYQESKAEQSAASLQKLLRVIARVKRDGEFVDLGADELVPGDWVQLESGMRVPADLRILAANQLAIDESFLTGESVAANKTVVPLGEELPVSDRRNMAYAGSVVTTGRGTGVVVATGTRTEVGKIAQTVSEAGSTKPPLVIRMERFANLVSWAVVGACLLLGAVAYGRGMPLVDVFFLALALAVAAIPEGLPVAMTVALSIATSRMAKRNVIVRRLTAVEGLGSCTYIASDKTGTLTVNRQTVKQVWLPHDGLVEASQEHEQAVVSRLRQLTRLSMIASEAVARRKEGKWTFTGDAVDVAFWDLALVLEMDPQTVLDIEHEGEIPFESERAYAAAFYEHEGRLEVAVKGAPEVIFRMSEGTFDRAKAERELAHLSQTGHRVMAVAHGVVPERPFGREPGEQDLPRLEFVALVGLIDPPRLEVREAIEKCQSAGIQVAMVTGDHPLTALAIAQQVGIEATAGQVVTGQELSEIGGPEAPLFLDKVREARVFARVSPIQKLQIVDALIQLNHFVAVTGDGVNDAPALKKANIGVAMGSGTDVAKETAAIIVTDDNFASIEAGVEEGRFAYDNVRKVTYLLITTGVAEVILFTLALLSGLPIPLLPVQLLWLNLVTKGIQDVALAFEGGEPDTMKRPPRDPKEGVFNRLMLQETMVAGVVTALLAYGFFWVLVKEYGMSEFDARNRLFLMMVLIENYHTFNCRSEYHSVFRIPLSRNWLLLLGVVLAQVIHIGAMFLPWTQKVLRVAPVSLAEWLVPFGFSALILLAMEIFKVVVHGRSIAWAKMTSVNKE